jgi:hypothetical protein
MRTAVMKKTIFEWSEKRKRLRRTAAAVPRAISRSTKKPSPPETMRTMMVTFTVQSPR